MSNRGLLFVRPLRNWVPSVLARPDQCGFCWLNPRYQTTWSSQGGAAGHQPHSSLELGAQACLLHQALLPQQRHRTKALCMPAVSRGLRELSLPADAVDHNRHRREALQAEKAPTVHARHAQAVRDPPAEATRLSADAGARHRLLSGTRGRSTVDGSAADAVTAVQDSFQGVLLLPSRLMMLYKRSGELFLPLRVIAST